MSAVSSTIKIGVNSTQYCHLCDAPIKHVWYLRIIKRGSWGGPTNICCTCMSAFSREITKRQQELENHEQEPRKIRT